LIFCDCVIAVSLKLIFIFLVAAAPCSTTKSASLRRTALSSVATTSRRALASGSGGDGKKEEMPFGLGKVFGLTDSEPDNLIATDRDRRLKKGNFPDFIPPDVKKDFDELGVDNIEDLDELEDANVEGFNDLGLVPPEGTGTFASPILVPSRRSSRQVGYVDPMSHATFWFTIHNDDSTYYIKDLGLFFKMLHIPDAEMFADAHH
jgi:hypothetical protein